MKIPPSSQGDLSTIACYAAHEIDDFILERPRGFEATQHLVEMLEGYLGKEDKPFPDPAEALVIYRTIQTHNPSSLKPINTTLDLAKETNNYKERLKKISEISSQPKEELETLRSFCLSLSRAALSYNDFSRRSFLQST